MRQWSTPFLDQPLDAAISRHALIILNQPFSVALFDRVWNSCDWRCCADGGANRLYDLFITSDIEDGATVRGHFLPNLIKGDLDSIRDDVRSYYQSHVSCISFVYVIRYVEKYHRGCLYCMMTISTPLI